MLTARLIAVAEGTQTLQNLLLLLLAAVTTAWVLRLLQAPAVIGFLIAGIVIGPAGLGLVHDADTELIAELGLVLLLFTVGLELAPTPLLVLGRALLVAAGLQIGLCALAGWLGATAFGAGVPHGQAADGLPMPPVSTMSTISPMSPASGGLAMSPGLSAAAALIIGLALALSSTAIVLKQLSERGQIDTPIGAITTGILLVQDVLVIVVMILLPLFAPAAASVAAGAHAGHDGALQPAAEPAGALAILGRLGLAMIGLVAVTAVARITLPVVIDHLFRRGGRELMTLFAVLMACLGAWLAAQANWSWPLGACIAGLLLASSDLRHQLAAEIAPFRDLFNALFFVSIGMLVDREIILAHWPGLLAAVLVILLLKSLFACVAVRWAGWPTRMSIQIGLGLCTVSEFSYVLVREAGRLNMLPDATVDVLIAITVGTMLLGAMLVPVAGPLAHWLSARLPSTSQPEMLGGVAAHADGAGPHHVIVIGYGVNGSNLARVLRSVRIPFVVVEASRRLARQARAAGDHVLVGDATRMAILEHAGLHRARVLVVAIADLEAVRRIVVQVRKAAPGLTIVARTRFDAEVEPLTRLGANVVIPEEFETSIEIFAHVLRQYGLPNNVIEQQVAIIRAGRYGMFRGQPTDRMAHADWLHALEASATQTFLLQEGSPAIGRTIAALDLRRATGTTIVALTRAGTPTANPGPDFVLARGDVLVLVGPHRAIDAAKALLATPAPNPPE